jgi:hypothetical protein
VTLSVALAVLFGMFLGSGAAELSLYSGLLLAFVGLLKFRRKTRPWKIRYDAAGYQLEQAERKVHPTRVRFKRMLYRTLVCVPSAVAALVLFLFPVTSHFLHPRSQYLRHYRVPILWTATAFLFRGPEAGTDLVVAFVSGSAHGRYGATPFWDTDPRLSVMTFSGADMSTVDYRDQTSVLPKAASRVFRSDFREGAVPFTCWQYQPSYVNTFRDPWVGVAAIWEVNCGTSMGTRRRTFFVGFKRREDELSAFYKTIEHVTPVD